MTDDGPRIRWMMGDHRRPPCRSGRAAIPFDGRPLSASGDGGDDPVGRDPSDPVVIGVGNVDIAGAVYRDVIHLLKPGGIALVLDVCECKSGLLGRPSISCRTASRARNGRDDTGLREEKSAWTKQREIDEKP